MGVIALLQEKRGSSPSPERGMRPCPRAARLTSVVGAITPWDAGSYNKGLVGNILIIIE